MLGSGLQGQSLVLIGIALLFLGIMLIFIGFLASASSGARVEGGGVVLIGPIPIIFGTSGRAALLAALLGVIIMVLALTLYLLQRSGVTWH